MGGCANNSLGNGNGAINGGGGGVIKKDGGGSESFDTPDQEVLSEMGGEILRKMDGSDFFRENPARSVPAFEKAEMGFGRQLGEGSFCTANEIIAITLTQPQNNGTHKPPADEQAPSALSDFHSNREHHEHHYDMSPSDARLFMEAHCFRGADARYAVKRLKSDLPEEDRLKGTLDLAIECRFLAVLNHPNIIKMRGKASGDPMRSGFFLVLDRLYDTLAERGQRWRERMDMAKASCMGCIGGSKARNDRMELLIERITVAYDISSVFRHLHQYKLVYRDIKPDNIGFDVRNDIKVFDFGLCKELSPTEETAPSSGLYKMSGLTGCLDFMAPEVALGRPYNLSADVYSYGILLWEIMSLEVPFADLQESELIDKVARGGYRPVIDSNWPVQIRELIKDCWDANLMERPEFEQIASLLKSTLMAETACVSVQDRTEHMRDRSNHSFRGLVSRRSTRDSAMRDHVR